MDTIAREMEKDEGPADERRSRQALSTIKANKSSPDAPEPVPNCRHKQSKESLYPIIPIMNPAAFRALAAARRSTKRFEPNKEIPPKILEDIIETTMTSPSAFNLQPTHVLLVRKRDIKRTLADHAMLGAGNSYRVNDASAIAVFLSDLQVHKRLDRIMQLERKSGSRDANYLATLPVASTFLLGEGHLATMIKQYATNALSPVQPMPSIDNIEAWSYKNTSLMAQSFVFAATSHGLATCMMEGFDARRLKQILKVPDRYGIPMMVATGYEYTGHGSNEQQRTPRLDKEEVFFGDTFGESLDIWTHTESTK